MKLSVRLLSAIFICFTTSAMADGLGDESVRLAVERTRFETFQRAPRDLRRIREVIQGNPSEPPLAGQIGPDRPTRRVGQRSSCRYSSDFVLHWSPGALATAAIK